MNLRDYLTSIQKNCLQGIWSKGVTLTRDHRITIEKQGTDEVQLRVQSPTRPVSNRVQIWPEDEDAYCDCGSTQEICAHIAAATIFLQKTPPTSDSVPASLPSNPRLHYRFIRENGAVRLRRYLHDQRPLTESIVALIGGIQSGRLPGPAPSVTQDDYKIDALLTSGQPLTPREVSQLFRLLTEACPRPEDLTLDGQPIRLLPTSLGSTLWVRDAGPQPTADFILTFEADPRIEEIFSNGIARIGSVLHPLERTQKSTEKIPYQQRADFALARLPQLEAELNVKIETRRLPRASDAVPPRIQFELEKLDHHTLSVTPRLVYGTPVMAQVINHQLVLPPQSLAAPPRDLAAEQIAVDRLRRELNLPINQTRLFHGIDAPRFVEKITHWELATDPRTKTARTQFTPQTLEHPRLTMTETGSLHATFSSTSTSFGGAWEAWKGGDGLFWAEDTQRWLALPQDWFEKYGAQAARFLLTQERPHSSRPPSPAQKLDALRFLVELDTTGETQVPQSLEELRAFLQKTDQLPPVRLPRHFTATLRPYQQHGVRWLQILAQHHLGALLADDMGLGKTIQTLATLPDSDREKRILIVCPTSVIWTWKEQIEKFRPDLSLQVYHGPQRRLERGPQVFITSYALLRLDQALLTGEEWHTIILDEAQNIKNPDSQVSQAAFVLRARHRLALTGTPVENSSQDLWSLFHFLNPGWIPREIAESPVEMHRRTKPLILRRTKAAVAPDLPPKTESVLHCQLSAVERRAYEVILAATREEVLRAIETPTQSLGALEALLRLRQVCCHPALVDATLGLSDSENPVTPSNLPASSAKFDALFEQLELVRAGGHRALIFSQWTKLLDLLEPHFHQRQWLFSRLDGSTNNRGQVLSDFQKPDGPPFLLMSLKAGGVGLNLTAADHVFLLDPWWNPAAEDQAIDRTHRIGQTRPVLVYRMVAQDTLEEKVIALQQKKRALAQTVLHGAPDPGLEGGLWNGLDKNDWLELLSKNHQ